MLDCLLSLTITCCQCRVAYVDTSDMLYTIVEKTHGSVVELKAQSHCLLVRGIYHAQAAKSRVHFIKVALVNIMGRYVAD